MNGPLLLFVALLCTLSISVYFGKASVVHKEGLKNIDAQISEMGINDTSNAADAGSKPNATKTPSATTSSGKTTPAPTTAALPGATTTPLAKNTPASTTFPSPAPTKSPVYGEMIGQLPGDMNGQLPGVNIPQILSNMLVNVDGIIERLNNNANGNVELNSSDYILKTSIVPPINPKCPNCQSSNDVCTSCGGFGGCGTTSKYRNRFSDFLALYGPGYKGNGKWANIMGDCSGGTSTSASTSTTEAAKKDNLLKSAGSGVKDILQDTGSGIKDLLEDTGEGTTDLLRDAASGSTDLLRDAASGSTGLLRDTASGATNLLKETGSGALGLVKDLGSGVKDVLQPNPLQIQAQQTGGANVSGGFSTGYNNNPYLSGYYSQGTYNLPNNPLGIQGIDPYSYNGALVSKGGNYIPVTSDFSSFRK